MLLQRRGLHIAATKTLDRNYTFDHRLIWRFAGYQSLVALKNSDAWSSKLGEALGPSCHTATNRGQTRGARADSAARTAACSQLQVLPAEDGCLRGFISAEPWRMKRLQSAACPCDREEHNGRQPRSPPHARSGRERCWTNMYQEMLGSAQHIKWKGAGSTTPPIFGHMCGMPFSERFHSSQDFQWRGSPIMMSQPPVCPP